MHRLTKGAVLLSKMEWTAVAGLGASGAGLGVEGEGIKAPSGGGDVCGGSLAGLEVAGMNTAGGYKISVLAILIYFSVILIKYNSASH